MADQRSEMKNVSRQQMMWCIIVLVIAAIVRLAATGGDLCLDEIWSLYGVETENRNILDVFAIRHDNNHILNTLVMYALGPSVPGILYRIPPVIASIITVWLAGRIAIRRGGFPACVMAWILVGASYLLILYGTEARGYSYAICLAFLSWLFLLRTEATERWTDASVFAVATSIGFFAHLTFLYCYAGFFVWSLRKYQSKKSLILLLCHVPPTLTFIGLYLFFIRGMEIGGGPPTDVTSAIVSTLSIMNGGPLTGLGSEIVAVLVLFMIVLAFFRFKQADRAMAACYLTIMFLAPMVVLLKQRHAFNYPRYFLIPVAFALLLLSEDFSRRWRAGWSSRLCQIMLLVIYVVGNGWWTVRLFDHGRGDYVRALEWMAAESGNVPVTVSTDNDFRVKLVFDYYQRRLWSGKFPLEYITQDSLPPQGTDWFIRHNFEGNRSFGESDMDSFGNTYRLERTYWHRSMSGSNWWIYRREANKPD